VLLIDSRHKGGVTVCFHAAFILAAQGDEWWGLRRSTIVGRTGSRLTELKGGIEHSGLHGAELEKRASRVGRQVARRSPRRAARTGVGGCIARNPFAAMGVAIGAGIILGLLV
jgi:ElaB/YqjD/DUF883 family membrane-anchored ribosome-binding protein